MENISTNQTKGIMWMIIHCFLISAMAAIIRAAAEDLNVFQIVFLYNAFAFLFLLPFIYKKGGIKSVKTKKLKIHLGRALLGAISLSMYFYSFTVIPLTEARAIALTGPLVSSLMAVIFLKETTGWHRTSAMIVGFLGALLILRPGMEGFTYISLMVVVCVFMWSIIDIWIKTLSKTESNICQLFYLTGGMSLFTLPLAIYFWQTPSGLVQWSVMIFLGLIFLINVYAVTNAFRNGDVTLIMPFDFSGMVFTIIIAYFAFGEVVDIYTAAGSVIIMGASIYVVRREAKKAKEIHATIQKVEM